MTITELIERLEAIKDEFGDLDVCVDYPDGTDTVMYDVKIRNAKYLDDNCRSKLGDYVVIEG